MDFKLTRYHFDDKYTLGKLTAENIMLAYTLEDKDRHLELGFEKIAGETAIPRGRYRLILNWSVRFSQLTPLLLEVPDFTAIRIHPGNTHHDTSGCILVGSQVINDALSGSLDAYQATVTKLYEGLMRDHICGIEIA